jgi:hypothetical protein
MRDEAGQAVACKRSLHPSPAPLLPFPSNNGETNSTVAVINALTRVPVQSCGAERTQKLKPGDKNRRAGTDGSYVLVAHYKFTYHKMTEGNADNKIYLPLRG